LRANSRAKPFIKPASSKLEYDILSQKASVLPFDYTIGIGTLQTKTLEKVEIFS